MKKLIILSLVALGLLFVSGIGSQRIQAAQPPGTAGIKILYPNGGEVLKAGASARIKWTFDDSKGKVILVLYKKGIKHSVISDGAPNNGLFLWKIPPTLPEGNDYRVRIRLKDNLSVNDFSDRDFSIKK